MRWTIILGIAAIAVLGTAGASAILRLGGKAPAVRVPAEERAPASVAPAPPPPARPLPPPAQARAGAPAELPAPRAAGPEEPEHGSAGDELRHGRLGVRGRDLYLALHAFTERIAACARGDAPRRGGSRLLLRLEPMKDRLRVIGVEAEPGQPGAEALERCARAELLGREIEVAGATPGPAVALPIPVRP